MPHAHAHAQMFTSNSGHASAGPAAHGAGPGQNPPPPNPSHASVHPHSLPMPANMNSAGVDINVFDQDLNFDESLLYVWRSPPHSPVSLPRALPPVISDCPHSTSHVPRARHMARYAMTCDDECAIIDTTSIASATPRRRLHG